MCNNTLKTIDVIGIRKSMQYLYTVTTILKYSENLPNCFMVK